MKSPKHSGMLNGRNILEMPCKDVNRTVPYFLELKRGKNTSDDPLKDELISANKSAISMN